ncbi:MAG: hypothetical protein ACTSRN_02385 [Alphaproteobacteria bacterium]
MSILVLCATPMLAQTPLSAIDWLSESIKDPPEFQLTPDSEPLVPLTFQDIKIETNLSPVSPDAIGLLAPYLTGFSADLWGNMRAAEVADLLANHQNTGVPEAKNVFRRILLAQTNPAPDDTQNGLILQTRIDRLFEIGALDAAEALVALDTTVNPELFARMFDIAILTQRTTKTCDILKAAPALSNDLSTRVYCLARGGDWNAAALTLSLGASIGAIEPAREEMLIRFLDPELFEGEPNPVAPTPLTVMDFILREAVFLPRPAGRMPLPYLYRDIGTRAPQRARMKASERLVKAGSMPANLLFAAYRDGDAASSGGIWGRASSVQGLDAALTRGNPNIISRKLIDATQALASNGLWVAMADEYAKPLSRLIYSSEFEDIRSLVVELLLLSGTSSDAWLDYEKLNVRQRLALAVIHKEQPVFAENDALAHAVAAGLWGQKPDSLLAKRMLRTLDNGRQGQVILAALKLLSDGAMSDPEGIRTGLYVLSAAGQSKAAERIAVQILLLPQGG